MGQDEVWLTHSCRSLIRFEDQRAILFGAGIPAAFLPTAAELGRTDLIWSHSTNGYAPTRT